MSLEFRMYRLAEEDAIRLFEDSGALIQNSHLVYTSGKHGSVYVNKDAVSLHPHKLAAMAHEIALNMMVRWPSVVAGPTMGAVALSQWVAAVVGDEVLSVYVEEEPTGEKDEKGKDIKRRVLKRGFDKVVENRLVLVVEDVFTTGSSAKETIDCIRNAGGEVVGVGVLWNRNPQEVTAEFLGVPKLFSLINKQFAAWSADECPLCKELMESGGKRGVPINTELGHGKAFLRELEEKDVAKHMALSGMLLQRCI